MWEKEPEDSNHSQEKAILKEPQQSCPEMMMTGTRLLSVGSHPGILGQGGSPARRQWRLSPKPQAQLAYVFVLPISYNVQSCMLIIYLMHGASLTGGEGRDEGLGHTLSA